MGWVDLLLLGSSNTAFHRGRQRLLVTLVSYTVRPSPNINRTCIHISSLDIVCFMAKVNEWDHNAWVLAVDMKNKRLDAVSEFGAQTTPGNLKRPRVLLPVPYPKKQFLVLMMHDTMDWKDEDQHNSGKGMEGEEDNMDFDLFLR
ncbi:hypothetical protein ABZP36_035568 [Zizania latifolia]